MIVDSSAIIAILHSEPGAFDLAVLMSDARPCRLSAGSYVEVGAIVERATDPRVRHDFDELLQTARVIVEPVTQSQARIGREAYRDYGKGSGSPAKLNFGDCFAYALAKELREPLLYVGDDFSHTDVRSARD